jgi:hypothetical protein
MAYLASYSDLRAAYGTDTAAATYHYVAFGAAEGRTVNFDPVAYLLANTDLTAAGYDTSASPSLGDERCHRRSQRMRIIRH